MLDLTATDIDDAALALLERSAEMNRLEGLQTSRFDVCDDGARLPAADILVVSDLIYTKELASAVARRCCEALDRGMRVVVADPGRSTRVTFFEALASHGCCKHRGFQCTAECTPFGEWVRGEAAAPPDSELFTVPPTSTTTREGWTTPGLLLLLPPA